LFLRPLFRGFKKRLSNTSSMTTLRAFQSGSPTGGSTAAISLRSVFSSLRAFGDQGYCHQPAFILRGCQAGEKLTSDQPKQDQPNNDRIAISTPNWKSMKEVLHRSPQ